MYIYIFIYHDIDIIIHSRKSLLFNKNTAWIKKNNSSFDITLGSYDGAEVLAFLFLMTLATNMVKITLTKGTFKQRFSQHL